MEQLLTLRGLWSTQSLQFASRVFAGLSPLDGFAYFRSERPENSLGAGLVS